MHIQQFFESKLLQNGLDEDEAKKEADFLYEDFIWFQEVDQLSVNKAFNRICSENELDRSGFQTITEL